MRDIIKEAMNVACHFAGKKSDKTTEMIWAIGLKRYSDADIRDAIVTVCKRGESTFSIMTPKEFMKLGDPHGHKSSQKRIDETREMLDEQWGKR